MIVPAPVFTPANVTISEPPGESGVPFPSTVTSRSRMPTLAAVRFVLLAGVTTTLLPAETEDAIVVLTPLFGSVPTSGPVP